MKKDAQFFRMLSDETRLEILRMLEGGERCVCEIFPQVSRSQPTVSIQLGKLERAGLLASRRDGKRVFYRIADRRVPAALKMLREG